jgi:hypothetical protein
MEKRNCLEDYPWDKKGARYSELIAWLKENSGYTSNGKNEKILREALMSGIVMKRLNTKRYYRVVSR